ncbi:MAG TPA: Mth938-like domain-containing protein [Alphaproteobacteria bacterium]|nr:Mth938-like domain-containing protein [Alphaproteobacteria bacterium]
MTMDLTPLVPAGRQMIDSYGDGRFTVSGTVYVGSILVFPERTLAWRVGAIAEVDPENFGPIIAAREVLEVVLLGCGARLTDVPRALRQELRRSGLNVEFMDTGAACRTYNVLALEDRRVAAALIAVP